jgi:hypothetical protein
MLGKFIVTFVGRGAPTKKGSIEYSFVTGTVDKATGLFGGGLTLVNAWTKDVLSLTPFKGYSGIMNVSQMGEGMMCRLQSVETEKGHHEFYESKEAAELAEPEA